MSAHELNGASRRDVYNLQICLPTPERWVEIIQLIMLSQMMVYEMHHGIITQAGHLKLSPLVQKSLESGIFCVTEIEARIGEYMGFLQVRPKHLF